MLNFDPLHRPYASRRNVVYSHRGMVATSQPQAAQAGLNVLQAGGNAIDAAMKDELEKAVKSRDADLEEMKALMLEMQRELADAKAEKKRGRPAKVLEEEAAA